MQLNKENELLKKKVRSLSKSKQELLELEEQLLEAWKQLGFTLEEMAYKRARKREHQLIVAKELSSIF